MFFAKAEKKVFGGGDVKLIPETVLGLGTEGGLAGVLIGLTLLALVYGVKHILRKNSGNDTIPLGPWVAIGCIIAYFPLTA